MTQVTVADQGNISESYNEDNQVFEMTDFTTASDWEKFIADFEEILRKWNGLTNNSSDNPSVGPPLNTAYVAPEPEILKFGKVTLTARLSVYHPFAEDNSENEEDLGVLKDMNDSRYDFPARAHCIYRWFGCKKFIVITPRENEWITNNDKSKLLLGSTVIAMTNTNIYIPVFVQLYQLQRKYFHGIYEASTFKINYDMVHLKSMPDDYYYLSELANLFRAKIASPGVEKIPIKVSARFTHVLRDWPYAWVENNLRSELEFNLEDRLYHLQKSPFTILEYQTSSNPIDEIHLSASWSDLDEELVSDSQAHCNLDSMNAPKWTLRAIFKEKFPKDLVQSLDQLLQSSRLSKYSDQVLGQFSNYQEERELEVRAALDKLAGPPSLTLPQIKTTVKCNISEELRDRIMGFLFAKTSDESNEAVNSVFKDYRCFKSSPFNSLTWRLAILFYHLKDFSLLAFVWGEVIKELREHWEALLDLPRVSSGAPNLSTCLLNQKFQMLNSCIQQRRKREESINNLASLSSSQICDEPDDEEEQFFDAVDQEELTEKAANQPEGRLHRLNDLRLLQSNEPLFVPITQEPPPMTEDMVQEHAKVLSELGTSSEAAKLRARMQSASLMSDMEAFKAANPGCILEDFVRWHSPRDYIEGGGGDDDDDECGDEWRPIKGDGGYLSARMQHPGNMWREAWDAAKDVPVNRQKRLFDYTKEAEKVLHYLASFTLKDLIVALMPNLIHCATGQLIKMKETLALNNVHLSVELAEIGRQCSMEKYDNCLTIMGDLESKLIKLLCLKRILTIVHNIKHDNCDDEPLPWSKIGNIAFQLVQNIEIDIPGANSSYLGNLIVTMFTEACKLVYEERTSVGERVEQLNITKNCLQLPLAKEYILKASSSRPSIYSKLLPNRMFALVTPNEFRLCGAFSEDTLFT